MHHWSSKIVNTNSEKACAGMWADACDLQQVGVREAGDEQELVSLSMERALRELDTVITQAFGMQVSMPSSLLVQRICTLLMYPIDEA